MLTEKPFYFKPRYAPRNKPVEAAMGHFIMTWAVLEGQLDCALAVFFDSELELMACITSNMGTKAKIDSLRSAISMHESALPQNLCKRADKLLLEIGNLASDWRNLVAHGFPSDIQSEKGQESVWHWSRQSARKGLQFSALEMKAHRWRAATTQVKGATAKWCKTYQAMWNRLAKLSPEERAYLSHIPHIRQL